jgi:RHH-type transcriptional regulator, rel operon repressor / antitoxin RelB
MELGMPTSVRLSSEVEKRLSALSVKTARSKAYYLREIIERGLEDVEDYYLAVEAMERLKRGEDEIISHEEFWRGMED